MFKNKKKSILKNLSLIHIYKDVIDKYSYLASYEDIKENDYNLNIPRYVDTFEEEEMVDIEEVKKNIANIEKELAEVQAQMKNYLEELGL